jgi:hypothetical protein
MYWSADFGPVELTAALISESLTYICQVKLLQRPYKGYGSAQKGEKKK